MVRAQHSLKPPYCTCLDRDEHYQGRLAQQNTTFSVVMLVKTLTDILYLLDRASSC